MDLSLRQIRYFIAAAEAGQVSKAAMNIHVSQSAITTAIKKLEQTVGSNLFDRTHSGITLTYEGNLFLEHAQHIVQSVEEAVRIPKRVMEDVRGNINLVVTYTVAGYFLPKLITQFSRAFPNVTVNLAEADRCDIEEGLISEEFDIAVMLTSNIVNHEDLSHSPLMRSRRRLWVSVNHPFVKQKSVSLQDISKEPYIMLSVDEASNTAQRYWSNTTYQPNTIFRTSSVEAVRSMVANGMGVSLLSDMVYRPWSLEGRRVEVLDVAENIPTMVVGLAWAAERETSITVQAFVDFMHLSMGAEQPLNV
ncbi:MAG: LysR family transcriptional regulator [Granulosicoccus sp.]